MKPGLTGCLALACMLSSSTFDLGASTPEATTAASDAAQSRRSELQGSVYLSRNRKVAGASVMATLDEDASKVFLTSSDARGAFRLRDLPDGTYRVEITRDGLDPVITTGISVRYPYRAVVDVPMHASSASAPAATPAASTAEPGTPRLTVEGLVVERDGEALADMDIRWRAADGREDPRFLRSDLEGTFELQDLATGAWRVEIAGVGFLTIRANVGLQRPTEMRVSMVRQPADFTPSPLELMPPERPIPPPGLPGAEGLSSSPGG